MVGFTQREQAEAIYREGLQELSDEELGSELQNCAVLLKATIPGPYTEDLWQRECLLEEIKRRKLTVITKSIIQETGEKGLDLVASPAVRLAARALTSEILTKCSITKVPDIRPSRRTHDHPHGRPPGAGSIRPSEVGRISRHR